MHLSISLLGNKRWWSVVFLEGSLNFHALIKEGLLSLKWRHQQKATRSKPQMISSLLRQKQTLKMTDNSWSFWTGMNWKRSERNMHGFGSTGGGLFIISKWVTTVRTWKLWHQVELTEIIQVLTTTIAPQTFSASTLFFESICHTTHLCRTAAWKKLTKLICRYVSRKREGLNSTSLRETST